MINLIHGDCLVEMANIPDGSVDAIICDPPYGIDYQSSWTTDKKPIDINEQLISSLTKEGDNVLDCFLGSGSCGIAAKKLNRKFIGIELDAGYFEIAKNRIEAA